MKTKLRMLAFIQNDHWQVESKQKYLNSWIEKYSEKFCSNLSDEFGVNITIIEEIGDLSWKDESIRTKKKIMEIEPHIILNMPRPIIDNIGFDYFSKNNIIVFNQDKRNAYKEEEISNTSIFCLHSFMFDPIGASIWFAKQNKMKKLLVFSEKGLSVEDFKNHNFMEIYKPSIKLISINKEQKSKIINGRKVKNNSEKFVSEVKNFTTNDILNYYLGNFKDINNWGEPRS